MAPKTAEEKEAKVITDQSQVDLTKRYLITADNPEYSGKAAGLQFNHGRAVWDPSMADSRSDVPPDQVVARLLDLKVYTIQEI